MAKRNVSVPKGTEIAEGNSYLVVAVRRSNGSHVEFAGVVPDYIAEETLATFDKQFARNSDGNQADD